MVASSFETNLFISFSSDCSEGNCTVQIGLVQLYALVMSLERDHEDRLKGVSIEYGGEAKNYQKVAQTLGWSIKT